MRRFWIHVFIVLSLISCEKEFQPNENLISFDINYDVTDREANTDTLMFREFDPKFDTIKYLKNEIYVSYLAGVVGCLGYRGDVAMRNDSIILKLPGFGETVCTELNIVRLTYRIKNPNNRRYKIIKAEN